MKSGSVSTINDTFSLEKWNSYYNELYLPNTVLLTIGLLIGTFGNATVIIVYQRGLKNKGHGRFFIPILATIDLICVLLSATYNIVQITRHVTFPGSLVCKLFIYSIRVILGQSVMVMTAIAVTRLQQICQITKHQITKSHLRVFIVCAIIFCALSNIPTLFVFGTVKIYKENITGYKCMEIDNDARALENGIMTFTGVFHALCLFIVFASYISIAVHLFNIYHRRNKLNEESTESGKGKDSMQSLPRQRRKTSLTYRLTFMFFTLQLSLLLAFIPPFIVIKQELDDPNFWDRKSDKYSKNVYLAMRMFYFMNAIVNPFLYGFFDTSFRRKLFELVFKRKIPELVSAVQQTTF
ncbi:pyroglutamylated RF-amide peptide receptor-like [Crassostrea angulata]|uniref:pyroglutamylated RF-amide peptide receptor-like n=1 Tax=Magallana angulata TaxID=2784310 RepID=UPI0022B13EC2|nr:pyroglutamylated RF-amide peptide receptor-like [Crassostrea angulata]